MQVLILENVYFGTASQLRRFSSADGPSTAPLSAISGLERLDLYADDEKPWLNAMKQLAALAPHARQLTALMLWGGGLLAVTPKLAELATSLRLLPGLRDLEVTHGIRGCFDPPSYVQVASLLRVSWAQQPVIGEGTTVGTYS